MNQRQSAEGVRAKRFGEWEVVGWLGGAGAGDVYEVRDAENRRGVVKVFRQARRTKVAHRYEDEIAFLDSHREYPGILPFVDSQLTEDSDRSFWYASPFALPLNEADDIIASPYEVIRVIATVAAALAELALQGVHHRNLKPSNIFVHEGKPVVGDFAVIPVDQTIDLTSERPIKPSEFIAPEAVRANSLIDAERADVYSLATVLSSLIQNHVQEISGLSRLIAESLHPDVKARPNMARFSGELFAIFDRAEIEVFPESDPELDEAAGRLNTLLEGEARTDESRREELTHQARVTYAALIASVLGTSLNSLARIKTLHVQEVQLNDDEVSVPIRKAHLLHKAGDAIVATVPGAVFSISIHAGFWEGIESDRLQVSVQREWGEAAIAMRIYWIEADAETEVWAYGWQQTLRAARSARSFGDLARQVNEHLALAYEYLSNWVERREMPDSRNSVDDH